MARLEDITRGSAVRGILPDSLVTVIDVKWIGTVAIEATYKDAAGKLGSELLTYQGHSKLAPLVRELPWTHNLLIMSRCKRDEEREFYLRLATREKWGKPDIAAAQIQADQQRAAATTVGTSTQCSSPERTAIIAGVPRSAGEGDAREPAPPPKLGRFHGSVPVDSLRLGRDAAKIAEEVVQHLTGLVGAEVNITIEIQANLPDGANEKLVRDVTENCRTLKFTDYGFEET